MSSFACPFCGLELQDGTGPEARPATCPRCGKPTATQTPVPAAAVAGPPTIATWPAHDDDDAPEPNGDEPRVGSTHVPAGHTRQEYEFLDPAQAPDELGRLGPYRVQRIIGTGGMGIVFQAEDTFLRRPVAIKAMLPSVAGRGFNRQRFLREAQATASIEHEHIVTIFQVSEQRGIPYLVMQYLQGESLEGRLMRERRLPFADALRICRETGEALAAAHERNLVHRDVKPANIWLEGAKGKVKLLDFGLARLTAEDTQLTRTGVILGTPAYMSPEQARGKVVDHLGDLFSLGCVLYQMCTGILPFKGADVMSRLVSLVMDDPPAMWEAAPDIPPALEQLVLQMLSKNPGDRPDSARAVVEAISALEGRLGLAGGPASGPSLAAALKDSGDDFFALGTSTTAAPTESANEVAPPPTVAPLPTAPGGPARSLPPVDLTRPVEHLERIAGHTLGRFELGPVIGRGFHGVIFRAHDLKFSQPVALKVLFPEFPQNNEELERFIRATKALLTLRHANLASVTAVGRTGPYCWLSAELIDGENLTVLLSREKQDNWRFAFRLAVQMARALEFVGENHLRHGNVTPQNIMAPSGDKNFKLTDVMFFHALKGSALRQAVRRDKNEAEAVYLAPEVLDGKGARDESSDLYSIGVLAYQLLTGRLPFEGETPQEVLKLIYQGEPTKPRKLRKTIPSRLEWVVLQMLNRDPKYRFQTSTELLVYLDRIAQEQGVEV